MIAKHYIKTRKDGIRLYKTYSTDGFKIRQIQTGFLYDEAIDVENSEYVYEETMELIETTEQEDI